MEDKIKAVTAIAGLLIALITLWNSLSPDPNRPPISINISSNASNPIYMGSPIKFVAWADDPDNDPIDYKFLLKGPYTDNIWKIVSDWSPSDNWIWDTGHCYNPGNYTVVFMIRDNKHSQSKDGDDLKPKGINLDIKTNICPVLKEINISPPSPHTYGDRGSFALDEIITVRAIANDPERDTIMYKFSLNGPSTNDKWKPMQFWSEDSKWRWVLDESACIGLNQIKVEVMDREMHCDKCNASYVEGYRIEGLDSGYVEI